MTASVMDMMSIVLITRSTNGLPIMIKLSLQRTKIYL